MSDYYQGSWLAIATMTLNGDLGRACGLLFDNCLSARAGLSRRRLRRVGPSGDPDRGNLTAPLRRDGQGGNM